VCVSLAREEFAKLGEAQSLVQTGSAYIERRETAYHYPSQVAVILGRAPAALPLRVGKRLKN
jgi:hypothetical protein